MLRIKGQHGVNREYRGGTDRCRGQRENAVAAAFIARARRGDPLGGDGSQPLTILANGLSVGEGRVLLDGEKVNVEVIPASEAN